MEVTIDLTFLRDWQKEFIKNSKQYNVLVVHRRAGKTTVAIAKLLYEALNTKGSYGYISPFYRQSKAIAWDILKKFAKAIPNTKANESELTVELFNGSKIRLFGADNPDSLRGLDLTGVVFDEYSQQPANIYGEIVFPMILANNGWVLWIGTPKGKNNFYKVYANGRNNSKYYTLLLKASESMLLTNEQLNEAKGEITEEEYAQEYECSFDAAIKGAYYAKEINRVRDEKRIVKGLYDPMLPVFTVWDLGISDYMAILFVQIHGNTVRIIDCIQHNGEGFEFYARLIREKEAAKGYKIDKFFFPHDIEVRELTTGASRLETVRDIFGTSKCFVLPRLGIMDGINAARKIFHNIWFDEDKTEELIEALSLYKQKYDEKRDIFLNTPEHDWTSHLADAFRYMAIAYNDLIYIERDERPINIDFSGLL